MGSAGEILAALRGWDELKLRIIRDIGRRFTVALFAGFDSEKEGRIRLAGTGTLLIADGSHYILTAAHVWEEVLKSAAKIMISLMEDREHSFRMDVKTIVPYGLPKPSTWGEWGPDMIFLRIPSEYLGTIKAYRDFYSPAVDGKATSTASLGKALLLMGTPQAFGTITDTLADVQIGGCFFNPDTPCETRGEFDYFDLEVDASSPGAPEGFGGVSGGGLWKVLVHSSNSIGGVDWVQTLEGVAFYQSAIKNGRRIIRCHGPRTVLAAMPPSS